MPETKPTTPKDNEVLERTAELERASVDMDARTAELAFSSEYPVRRWFGVEVLGHARGEADFSRLNNGGPLLIGHDEREHHGVVVEGSARIDADGIGRALVRFADDELGSRYLGRVRDGIIRSVSMRYTIRKARLEREERDDAGEVTRHYRATEWQPVEISLVPVPADPTVGVGRSFIPEGETMPNDATAVETVAKKEPTIETPRESASMDVGAVRAQVERESGRRVADILKIMDRYKENRTVQSEGRRAIADGMPSEQFGRAVIFDYTSDEIEAPAMKPPTNLGLSSRETRSYSLLRACRALVISRERGTEFRSLAPFEADCSSEIAERLQREPNGLFVPFDVQDGSGWNVSPQVRHQAYMQGMTAMRAPPMSVGMASTEGSDLVGTSHLANQFIEALRPATVVIAAGARVLDGLVGNVDIPKQDGTATFAWEGEDDNSADTEVPTGTVTLAPTTVAGSVPITRRLLKQSSPAVEAIVRNDLILGAGEALDFAAIQGTGANDQPTGIRGQTGVNTVTLADQTNFEWTHEELVGFETAVGADNALRGSPLYLTTWALYGHGKTTVKGGAGSGRFLVEGNTANGYPIVPTTQVPTAGTLFGDFSQVLIGMWGTIDINVDRATKAASGGLVLRAFLDCDVAVRHGESFAIET